MLNMHSKITATRKQGNKVNESDMTVRTPGAHIHRSKIRSPSNRTWGNKATAHAGEGIIDVRRAGIFVGVGLAFSFSSCILDVSLTFPLRSASDDARRCATGPDAPSAGRDGLADEERDIADGVRARPAAAFDRAGGGPIDPSTNLAVFTVDGVLLNVPEPEAPFARTLFPRALVAVEGVSARLLSFASFAASDNDEAGRMGIGVVNVDDSLRLTIREVGPGVLPPVPRTPNFLFSCDNAFISTKLIAHQ